MPPTGDARSLREQIKAALAAFNDTSLSVSAANLLKALGYTSGKVADLGQNAEAFLGNIESFKPELGKFNRDKVFAKHWRSCAFLFQITNDEIPALAIGQSLLVADANVVRTQIESFVFLAIDLEGDQWSRTALAGIARELNRRFPMPAILLFRHGALFSLAVIDRRASLRDATRDVVESKITVIKDVRLDSPHRAHLDILAGLALVSLAELKEGKRPTNFRQLYEAWIEALSIQELNKSFYGALANWYFWALTQVQFPKDAPKDADSRDSLSLIRLITRIIFCWFLKEKGLLPDALFNPNTVATLLNDDSPAESTYYKAILQNLFFATLNQEMDQRVFRKAGQNFMAHNLYRYRSLMKQPDAVQKLLAAIPFMNGGLFECLDKTRGTKEKPEYVRIDGFSDREDNPLKIPNDLFFGEERIVDLSDSYGDKKFKSAKVSGLIHILDRYKFTVAENTPIEEEVALDPELLGKVFENLLAAYNPETGATARKQTGSFYTPREIVNYMVDESLIDCFKTKLEAADLLLAGRVSPIGRNPMSSVSANVDIGLRNESANKTNTTINTELRLRHLFTYNDQPHSFAADEVKALIAAIDHLKILDLACGSGAFPMGVLHKLVFVLGKLDPGNRLWKARQLAKASEIPDATVRERVMDDIEQTFGANELDYGRKLYLIENCIYGADIQPIAVQITKLRFFISLVVEQKINPETDNLGIRPLPNLETKFVAANTLIGIDRPGQQQLRNMDIDVKEAELRRVRERHFLARTPTTKAKCREQDFTLRAEIAELLKGDGWNTATACALADWNPYDQNASAGFFEPEWMFGLLTGFDVCIGNPPWVSLIGKHGIEDNQNLKEVYLSLYAGNTYMPNLYEFFLRRGLSLINANGYLVFIIPDRFGFNESFASLRKLILERHSILQIVYKWHFESVIADTMTILIRHSKEPFTPMLIKNRPEEAFVEILASQLISTHECALKGFKNLKTKWLVEKLIGFSTPLRALAKSTSGFGGKSSLISQDRKTKDQTPILKGASITRYSILGNYYFDFKPENLSGRTRDTRKLGLAEKILLRKTGDRIIAAFDDKGTFPEQSLYFLYDVKAGISPKFILGLLNSRLVTWFYLNFLVTNLDSTPQLKNYDLDSLPIRVPENQTAIVSLVDEVLATKRSNPDTETLRLEREIDDLVYKLYALTTDEVHLVEQSSKSRSASR